MIENGRGSLEILVHTTAPSRGKDDAFYRALASAYLLFEPVRRMNLDNDRPPSSGLGVTERSCNSTPQNSISDVVRQSPKTTVKCDEDNLYDASQYPSQSPPQGHIHCSNSIQSFESPQASFNSVLDNLDSPVLLKPIRLFKTPPPPTKGKTEMVVTDHQSSWETPPSIIPDSQSPYTPMMPEFSSPTRVLELYRQHFDTSKSVTATTDIARSSQFYDESSNDIFLDFSQPEVSSPLQAMPPVAPTSTGESVDIVRETPYAEHRRIPVSPRLSKKNLHSPRPAASEAGHRAGLAEPNPYHVPPPELSRQLTSSPSRRIMQTSPQHKRRKVDISVPTTKSPQHKTSKLILAPIITPNEIHPPPPRTSSWGIKPAPIITPALQLLATQLELSKRYRPKTQTRLLCDLERGYWAVEIGLWPTAVRDQAWIALGAYLSQGRAGWGVWAVKGDVSKMKTASLRGERERLGLRVYCWGGVAGHVYLLLYLVSQRRVKGTGARWVDGGGDVVVCMP